MFITTEAIVLNSISYSDSKNIVTLFTKDEGLVSAIISLSSKKSMLEPFSLVEVVLKKSSGSLCYVKEILPHTIFYTIPFDAVKQLIAIFMAEVVYRTLKDFNRDMNLYSFLYKSILALDRISDKKLLFLPLFLLKYGRCLGIYPNEKTFFYGSVFDLHNGIFCYQSSSRGGHIIAQEYSQILGDMLKVEYDFIDKIYISNIQAIDMLDITMQFLEFHLPDFKKINSIEILKQVI